MKFRQISAGAGIERALLLVGVVCFGFCALAYLESAWTASAASRLLSRSAATGNAIAVPISAQSARADAARSGLIGRIELPRLGLAAAIAQGVDNGTLQRAVGHVPGTAFPGELGNVALAGHRDTFFRRLGKVTKGDLIRITTTDGTFNYRVQSIGIVVPENTEVLASAGTTRLTLITCYPFAYVGPAPYRFVVRAELAG